MSTEKQTSSETIGRKMGEVAGAAREAAETAGDKAVGVLSDGWEQFKDGAHGLKDRMVAEYERGLEEVRKQSTEWSRKTAENKDEATARLDRAVAHAERELEKLKVAGEVEWENARHSFNTAWNELRSGAIAAREAFHGRRES